MPRATERAVNVANALRPREQPYASWTDTQTGFKIFLLRSVQVDNAKSHARWHTYVRSDFSEYGDQYVAELQPGLWYAGDLEFDTRIWPDRDAFVTWARGSA